MLLLIVLKFVSLFFGIWFTNVNLGKLIYKQKISESNFFIQAISITIFIFIQFKLY